jgi:guanidinopropionase
MQGKQSTRESMTPVNMNEAPLVYGSIPTFLGAQPVRDEKDLAGLDAVVAGLPWEGTNTWGSFSGTEQTPKACRMASLRFGTAYIPEYDVEVMKSLAVGDWGDFPTYPNDTDQTFRIFEEKAASIFKSRAVPFFMGGDHSVTYPVLDALTRQHPGKVGLIHFDSHLDNMDEFGGDRYSRCSPLRRIAELPDMDVKKMVHIGVRGPRNSASQMAYVRSQGIPIFSMAEIKKQGLDAVLDQAIEIANSGTDGYYVTVCSDIIDYAFNPGGPLDFGGLSSGQMMDTLFRLGQGRLLGMDVVEVYPLADARQASIHLVDWLLIYAMGGMALRRKSSPG